MGMSRKVHEVSRKVEEDSGRFRNVQKVLGSVLLGHEVVPGIFFKKCAGSFQEVCRKCLGSVQKVSRKCPGSDFQEVM